METARRLVEEQFPQWSQLLVRPVKSPGWDNFIFHLGNDMLVRLPSAAEYALAVEKEHYWLPQLARQLPISIPVPLGLGQPGAGYPFLWSIYGWIPGETADHCPITDTAGIAEDLTDFLLALRGVDAMDGPRPGIHNWFRGATLRTFDLVARGALDELEGHLDVGVAAAAWEDALAAPWDGVDVWFHGDLAPGNMLLKNGRLASVIDFGTCGVGDPSCDLAIAWTLLDHGGRQVLRQRLDIEASTWARGRGWALWKSLQDYTNAVDDHDDGSASEARRVIGGLLEDYSDTP